MRIPSHRVPALAVAIMAALLAACSDDDRAASLDPALVAPGTLTVCADAPLEPFVFEDPESPSGYSGFDIDLMQAIADGLGNELTVHATPFESLVSGAALAEGRCDVAASAIAIADDWAEAVAFTDPYYEPQHSLVAASDSGLIDLALADGHRIGVVSGTTGDDYADTHLPDGVRIARFATTADAFAALDAGSIDGVFQDLPTNLERARADAASEIVDTVDTGERYGFAVSHGREDALLETLNASLEALRADGTYDRLHEQYFGTD